MKIGRTIVILLAGAALAGCHQENRTGNPPPGKQRISAPYRPKDMRYFLEVAPQESGNKYMVKWDKPIFVGIAGEHTEADSLLIDEVIRETAPAILPMRIGWAKGKPNLVVNFITDAAVYEKMHFESGLKKKLYKAYTRTYRHRWGEGLRQVDIILGPRVKNNGQSIIFRHEFMHALGFGGHTTTLFDEVNLLGRSSFPSAEASMRWSDSPYYPKMDLAALAILYDTAVPVMTHPALFLEKFDTSFRHP